MKILEPFYYKEFKCSAMECEDFCCKEWKVYIDKKTFLKYKKIKSDFGKEINKCMKRVRSSENDLGYGKINFDKSGYCPLLDEKKLCRIHKELGENYLSNTCKVYPRTISFNGNIYERGVSLSCPEVANILVNHKDKITFDLYNGEISEVEKKYIFNDEYNRKLNDSLWMARSFCIEVAQFREIDIWKRLVLINMFIKELQIVIDSKEYNNILDVIEKHRNRVCSAEVLSELESFERDDLIKIDLIKSMLDIKYKTGIKNNVFNEIVSSFYELLEDEKIALDNINKLYLNMEKELIGREYIMENYIVYNIYNNFMKALYSGDVLSVGMNLSISYAIIMALSINIHKDNSNNIEKTMKRVMYSFSRNIEHDNRYINLILSLINRKGYNYTALSIMLVR